MAVDPVVIGHEAEEMAADAVTDMDDGQPRRGVDQGVEGRGHVEPAPAVRSMAPIVQ